MVIYLRDCTLGKEEYTDILKTVRHRVCVDMILGDLKCHYGPTIRVESYEAR